MPPQVLTRNWRHLLEIGLRRGFCTVWGLQVENGEPCFSAPLKITRKQKYGSTKVPDLVLTPEDIVSTSHVRGLMNGLRLVGKGVIEKIEFQNGLPIYGEIEEVLEPLGPNTKK